MKKNKNKKSKVRKVFWAIDFIITLIIVGGVIYNNVSIPTGRSEAFSNYAKTVSELTIPENTRIVALGEATHGNVEFQELKLDVFKVLVEKYHVKAFVLEGDFGGCDQVNEYIHGGEGTAKDAAAAIGFAIYRTEQMENLIDWMRDYNAQADEAEKLSFYGMDMQRYDAENERLKAYLGRFANEGYTLTYDEGLTGNERVEALKAVQTEMGTFPESEDTAAAMHLIDCMLQNIQLGQAEIGDTGYLRDQFMAENVNWVLEQQKDENACIMIAGHNGHIAQKESSQCQMGKLLAEQYGEQYFAIGTDFYKTSCNLPQGDRRVNHTFYSKDPMAAMARAEKSGNCYLDFAEAGQDAELNAMLHSPMKMGSLGESYTILMRVFSYIYRIQDVPAELYDAMIFVPYATPTSIY